MRLIGVMDNKLYIAAAGAGKTTTLVKEALKLSPQKVLITTFTESNAAEIKSKLINESGCCPENIEVVTWFSFLLRQMVRPYQSELVPETHKWNIGFYLVSKKSGQRFDSDGEPIKNKMGFPMYWGADNPTRYYFTSDRKIYSDKISIFSLEVNKAAKGKLIKRLEKVFDYIFIDEIQDMVGYDLDIIKLLLSSKIALTLVGDPRQVTYTTHFSAKYKKYGSGKVKEFIENELGKNISCKVDTETLKHSHRNPKLICDYSSMIYSNFPKTEPCNCVSCKGDENVDKGVFRIDPKCVRKFLTERSVTQLRWGSNVSVEDDFPVFTYGNSKGKTFDNVLLYPTKPMIEWIKNNDSKLTDEARAKFYVGITRAKNASVIVLNISIQCNLPTINLRGQTFEH
jgi:DNA helicase-2/ATP-dependent DNA helicase PcrA